MLVSSTTFGPVMRPGRVRIRTRGGANIDHSCRTQSRKRSRSSKLLVASDFAAEIGVRNYPRLAVFSGDLRGAVHARSNGRRRPSKLSAETKWEIFLQVTAGEISQAEAAASGTSTYRR